MTDTITIPLNRLTVWDGNVRKTGFADGIDELAASIAAHGLLQSLIVRKTSKGRYAVIAGRRRFLALSALANDGRIAGDMPVPCRAIGKTDNAAEIGLAENVVRVAMHPADQFEAFRALIDGGATAADIAARFGVTESLVVKRMKLGRVAPALLAVYRHGDMSLEQVQAFTVSDDHAAQEAAWEGLPTYNRSPYAIRAALTEGDIPASDKRVRCVGLDAYEQAGGFVRRDLFDDRAGGYVTDAALLDRLARQKLDDAGVAVRAEGWAWVETRSEFSYSDRRDFDRIEGEAVPLPGDEAAELEALTDEQAALHDLLDDEAADDSAESRLAAIEARLSVLTDRLEHWPDADKARSGAVVYIQHDGSIMTERGLIRPEDAEPDDDAEAAALTLGEAPAPVYRPKLVMDLTGQKTAALRAELAQSPGIALAAVTHSLALQVFRLQGDSCLRLRTERPCLCIDKPDDCRALAVADAEHEAWGDRLPGDADALWQWCLVQPQTVLLDLLAHCAAYAVDAVDRDLRPHAGRLRHADRLAEALKLDMTGWFTPTASNLFSRITRTGIIEALQEARNTPAAPGWLKLKKTDLAILAERAIEGTGWLPTPLRPARSEASAAADDAATLDMAA